MVLSVASVEVHVYFQPEDKHKLQQELPQLVVKSFGDQHYEVKLAPWQAQGRWLRQTYQPQARR